MKNKKHRKVYFLRCFHIICGQKAINGRKEGMYITFDGFYFKKSYLTPRPFLTALLYIETAITLS